MATNGCDPCDEGYCLYVEVEDVRALMPGTTLSDDEIEGMILDAMWCIDSYVQTQQRANRNQAFEFPRECDSCIPIKIRRVALALSLDNAESVLSGGCSKVDSDAIQSETNGSHSYTKFDRNSDDGFTFIPEKFKRMLDEFRAVSGYLEFNHYVAQPRGCPCNNHPSY